MTVPAWERTVGVRISTRNLCVLAAKAIVVLAVGVVAGHFIARMDTAEVAAGGDGTTIPYAAALIIVPLMLAILAAGYEITGWLLGLLLYKLWSWRSPATE